MRKRLTLVLLFLLMSCIVCAQASAEGAHNIVPANTGSICDIVYANGWTYYAGLAPGTTGYNDALYGIPDAEPGKPTLIVEQFVGIVPCGDAIVYYAVGEDNYYHWLVHRPGQKDVVLPLSYVSSAFYGTEESVWYAEDKSGNTLAIYSVGLNGKGKRKIGTVRGQLYGVLADGSIITLDRQAEKVLAWKDGKTTTLYTAPGTESIYSLETTDDTIWVAYQNYFGRIVDGELRDIQVGGIRSSARSGRQLALWIVDLADTSRYKVMLCNDVLGAYTLLADAPDADGRPSGFLELHTDHIVVHDGITSILPIPSDASAWTPYEE